MADTKVPDLTGLSELSSLDEIYIVDKSDTTDSADGTSKKYAIGISSGFVGVDDTQNLSHKNLIEPTTEDGIFDSPTIITPIIQQSYTDYGPDPAETVDLTLDEAIHTIQMPAGNITLTVNNEVEGKCFMVEIIQDDVGSRTVTWFDTIKWTDGIVPTLTTTANKKDTFGFRCTGVATFDGYIMGQNI